MTTTEMKASFLILYDKVTNFAAAGYENDEISLFLTKAQEQLVKRYYNYKGNKYKEGFEETEKRRKDLAELIMHENIDCSLLIAGDDLLTAANGIFVELPGKLLYTLREEAEIENTTSTCKAPNGSILSVKPITHDEYTINIRNPFKRPDNTQVWRVDYSSGTNGIRRHELITDGTYTIKTYKIRYLRRPEDIVVKDDLNNITGVDSELNPSMHQEIVDTAVRIASGITDPQTYQIKVNEEQQGE